MALQLRDIPWGKKKAIKKIKERKQKKRNGVRERNGHKRFFACQNPASSSILIAHILNEFNPVNKKYEGLS